MRRRHLRNLRVQRVEELYKVCAETMPFDSRRSCWLCGEPFKLGDGMTVAFTEKGNKVMHSRCYKEAT